MDNLQRLAEKILSKGTRKVSCFKTLGEETGNLLRRHGNCDGNSTTKTYQETLMASAFILETGKETQGKPPLNSQETFSSNGWLEFPKDRGVDGLLDDFFRQVALLGLDLLHDDKRWLKTICVSDPLTLLEDRLNQYIECWIEGMALQKLKHRKQNAGRFRANVFFREAMSIETRSNSDDRF
jgi:hypothetical protein